MYLAVARNRQKSRMDLFRCSCQFAPVGQLLLTRNARHIRFDIDCRVDTAFVLFTCASVASTYCCRTTEVFTLIATALVVCRNFLMEYGKFFYIYFRKHVKKQQNLYISEQQHL
jgi:hypothetical protein